MARARLRRLIGRVTAFIVPAINKAPTAFGRPFVEINRR